LLRNLVLFSLGIAFGLAVVVRGEVLRDADSWLFGNVAAAKPRGGSKLREYDVRVRPGPARDVRL
jgi:hypothetical protein